MDDRGTPPGADGGGALVPSPPVVMGRVCAECRAFVTRLGIDSGVLCNVGACPWPRAGREPKGAIGGGVWRWGPKE